LLVSFPRVYDPIDVNQFVYNSYLHAGRAKR
jgi:hypothetical protein